MRAKTQTPRRGRPHAKYEVDLNGWWAVLWMPMDMTDEEVDKLCGCFTTLLEHRGVEVRRTPKAETVLTTVGDA